MAKATSANAATLAALGVVAYITETILHEAAGHGAVCIATGGKITLLSQLYMRCSVQTLAMVAAGPALNLLAGLFCFLALQMRRASAGTWSYFLWLGLVFNWLVAAGYLLVGAVTGFGDWPRIFADVQPDWVWRIPAAVIAVALYWAIVNLADRLFRRLTGLGGLELAARAKLVLVPTGAAAAVCVAAQLYGQGSDPLGLALALGCTLVVGLTLLGVGSGAGGANALRIPFSLGWVLAAALAAGAFIAVLGPGLDLSGP